MLCKYCGKEAEALNGFCEHCDSYIKEKKVVTQPEKENGCVKCVEDRVLGGLERIVEDRVTDHFGCALASTIMSIFGCFASILPIIWMGSLGGVFSCFLLASPLGLSSIMLAKASLVYASNNWMRETKPILARVFGVIGLVFSIFLLHIGISLLFSIFI